LKKEENIIEKQKAEEAATIAAPAAAPTQAKEEPKSVFQSFGMTFHNELTYRVVDLFLNTTAAVCFAVFSKRTKLGIDYFGKPVNNFFGKVTGAFSKNPQTIKIGADWGSLFTSIMVGGTAIIPLMMGLEKHEVKKSIVKWVDNLWYGKEKVENDPKFAETYASIDKEPKKDFWTGMKARFAVLLPMIAWSMTRTLNEPTEKYVYDNVAKGTKYAADAVGIKPKGFMLEVQDGKTNWEFLHKTIAFDLTLTAIYSYAHEFFYKRFAQSKADKHEAQQEQQIVKTVAAPEIQPVAEAPEKKLSPGNFRKAANYAESAMQAKAAEPQWGLAT